MILVTPVVSTPELPGGWWCPVQVFDSRAFALGGAHSVRFVPVPAAEPVSRNSSQARIRAGVQGVGPAPSAAGRERTDSRATAAPLYPGLLTQSHLHHGSQLYSQSSQQHQVSTFAQLPLLRGTADAYFFRGSSLRVYVYAAGACVTNEPGDFQPAPIPASLFNSRCMRAMTTAAESCPARHPAHDCRPKMFGAVRAFGCLWACCADCMAMSECTRLSLLATLDPE